MQKLSVELMLALPLWLVGAVVVICLCIYRIKADL